MLNFYFRIQAKLASKSLFYLIMLFAVILNVALRIYPHFFLKFIDNEINFRLIPINIFYYCDVYLLMTFVILFTYLIGIDFSNSMEDLSIVNSGSKINTFAKKKFISLLIVYILIYIPTYLNFYYSYKSAVPPNYSLVPMWQMVASSITTNIFIIAFSLFILFLSKNISITVIVFVAYYVIEEYLWRTKLMHQYGILGHVYYNYALTQTNFLKIKILYLLLSLILFFLTFKLSSRKSIC